MFPMNRKALLSPVVVEYTSRGKRVCREFPDAFSARRAYARLDCEGRKPVVVSQGRNNYFNYGNPPLGLT